MPDIVSWGALIAALTALCTIVKFWMDLAATNVRADIGASNASTVAALANAKTDVIVSQLSAFKVEVAQTYATARALESTQVTLARSLETVSQGIYSRLDNVSNRLDNLLAMTAKNGPSS